VIRRGRIELTGTSAELRERLDEIEASYLATATETEARTADQ